MWLFRDLTNVTICEGKNVNNTEFMRQLRGYYYTMMVLTGINTLLSLVGVLLVTKFRNHQYHSIVVIKGLIIFELFFNVCLFTVKILHFILHSNMLVANSPTTAAVGFMTVQALTTAFQLMRNWSVVIIAVIRYHSLTKFTPLNTPEKLRVVHLAMALIVGLSMLLGAPRFFDYTLSFCRPTSLFLELELGPLHNYNTLAVIYHTVVLTFVQTAGPLISVTVLSIRISLILKKRRRIRATLVGEGGHMDRAFCRMNQMVAIVTLSFLIFETPVFVSKLFLIVGTIPATLDLTFAMMANVAVCLDSMVNFVAYVLASTSIRCDFLPCACTFCMPCLAPSRHQPKPGATCSKFTNGNFVTETSNRHQTACFLEEDHEFVAFRQNEESDDIQLEAAHIHTCCVRNHVCETNL